MALLDSLPESVSIYEVSPRDGLQNEAASVSTHAKVRLIEALVDAGLKRIEVTSFVSPRWIPQLADASDLMRCLSSSENVVFSALVPNGTGLRRAASAGVPEVAVFVSVSETHNRKNVNKTVEQTLKAFEPVCEDARKQGMRLRGYVSTVWGCPYEGETDTGRALELAQELLQRGCYQVSLGDTDWRGYTLADAEDIETLPQGSLH